MKIYLAGERQSYSSFDDTQQALWMKHVKNRLYSFYYHGFTDGGMRIATTKELEISYELGHSLFLDSGAFTAFTKGVKISPREYARFIWRYQSRARAAGRENFWDVCSSLDFIGSGEEAAQASFKFFQEIQGYLTPHGMDVKPVFHVREPNHWLERYVGEGYPYILIGGMVPETTRWLRIRLDELWSRILTNPDGTPKVKVHGFGLTDQDLMFRYPWYSVDSSSWLMTGVFGAVVFRRENGRLDKVSFSPESPDAAKINGRHHQRFPDELREVVERWLQPYGVTAEQLASHYSYRDVVNAAVFQSLEDMATDKFILKQPILFSETAA